MTKKPANGVIRKTLRMILLLFFGHPQVFITVPLSIGLLVHTSMTIIRAEDAHDFTPAEMLKCGGVIAAMLIFALMAILHLVVVCYGIYRKNGAVLSPAKQALRDKGPRLDAIVSRNWLLKKIDELCQSRRAYAPVMRIEPQCDPPRRYFYQPVERAADVALDFDYCVFSPKAAFLPPRETLLQFNRTNGHFETQSRIASEPTAIVGVHPCDIHAIKTLDAAFSRDHPDAHYLTRRENSFIVGIDCIQPCADGVFCCDVGSNNAKDGFDVMLYPLSEVWNDAVPTDTFGVVFGTPAGRAWLRTDESDECVAPSTEDDARFDTYLKEKWKSFPNALDTDWEDVPDLLARSYDSLLWKGNSERCYSCGSCNLVCPTCYCFDIHDENDIPANSGHRERCWDACMLHDFALVAGDHNFRKDAANRLRHRIYRKGAWIADRTGQMGCVGCGRCTRACTAHINISTILNQLSEEARHDHHAASA